MMEPPKMFRGIFHFLESLNPTERNSPFCSAAAEPGLPLRSRCLPFPSQEHKEGEEKPALTKRVTDMTLPSSPKSPTLRPELPTASPKAAGAAPRHGALFPLPFPT